MTLPSTTSAASRLCTSCGLCCNGVMFHTVRLQPNDSPQELAALGLKLKRKKRQDYILQPCPAYRDAQCSIYLHRPERCRLFECRQLQRLEAGEITEAMAMEKIREVQQRAAQLDELSRRPDGSQRKGPLSKRCETALAEPFDATTHPELLGQREELARQLAELDAILDEDFRLPPAKP
jgi:Fe-S-cluster containining protein